MKLTGLVIHGKGDGKKLGYPTANVAISSQNMPTNLPDLPKGVFLCTLDVAGVSHNGLAVIGVIPPTSEYNIIEVYLFDFDGDLYNQEVKVDVGEKLRDIMPFVGAEELVRQIEKDIKWARSR